MKVSVNTVKQFIDFDLPPVDELVSRINQQLGGVEEVIDLSKIYKDVIIVRIVECVPLEGSDHLNVTKVDDGGKVEGVERDDSGLVQVVCGAPNVRANMFAVWLAPGVTVPETSGVEPFVLSAKPLRGVLSNGMLASPKELALGDSHEGILEIDPHEQRPNGRDVAPGASFAEIYGLDDQIIDIENKMFTHRPDLFGVLGVAREISGILHHAFASPKWYSDVPEFKDADGLQFAIQNDAPDDVPRFMAVAIKNVSIKQSPVWLQAELVRLGSKPINNIVDITNYVMLLTAQPMHAYDYDKVATGKLATRDAREGEKLTLLGGKVIDLDTADTVITDGEKPVALAGVMGGADTEVSNETKNIILECANFDMFTIRRTSMRHGIFTDAATRFTKGQSPLQNDRLLAFALQMISDIAGGEQASIVFDDFSSPRQFSDSELFDESFVNSRLGTDLVVTDIERLLKNVEFKTPEIDNTRLSVQPPFWRTDIEILEDVVEEVGRLYGFDKLPHKLPARSLKPAAQNHSIQLKNSIREILSRAGANEVLTYSFVHRNILEKAGQDAEDTYSLSNALSPDLHYLRRSLLPSLLDKVYMNVRAGYDKFALFELGKGHKKSAGLDDQGVPHEQQFLSLVLSDGGFYQAKRLSDYLAAKLNIKFEYLPIEKGKLFEPKRGALIQANGSVIGAIGEFRSIIKRNFKLPESAAGFEIDFDLLFDVAHNASTSYRPLSKFPRIQRDITLRVTNDTTYGMLSNAVTDVLSETDLDFEISAKGIYAPDGGNYKHITFGIVLTSHQKTLTGDDASLIVNDISRYAAEKIGAAVV
jgi:phenylalanyl-tRNA synthetase beta chain